MNKKIRTILIIIFTFIIVLGFSDRVFALKWDDGKDKIWFGDNGRLKTSLSEWRRDEDKSKKIEQVCMYYQDDQQTSEYKNGKDLDAVNYVFIYTDGSASFAVKSDHYYCKKESSVKADDGFTNLNICFDTYENGGLKRGMRNWCRNSEVYGDEAGTNCDVGSKTDAYTYYKKTGKCPYFMVRVADIDSSKYEFNVYLSYTENPDNMSSLEGLAGEATGDKYNYYNIGEPVLKKDAFETCEYAESGKNDTLIKFSLKNPSEGYPYVLVDEGETSEFTGDDKHSLSGAYLNSTFLSTFYLEQLNTGCPYTVDACREDAEGPATQWIRHKSNLALMGTGILKNCPRNGSTPKYYSGFYTFYCKGDNCNSDSYCIGYNKYEIDLSGKLDEYKKAKDINEKRNILNEYNIIKDNFNSWCVSTLSHGNYSDFGCLDKCIHIANTIANLETDAGLRSPYGEEKCNIGENVLFMVYNVLKWVKYIAPILVIVLSILDFIKALAAQSDDEMKKAQGKFIKRLVVAALLFLIPLIINFALKTFGFYHSGCDITDLFSGSK